MDISAISKPQKADLLVSFLDIQNFSGISRTLPDPLALFDLLDSVAVLMTRELEGAGGYVVKFIGDECLAVFPEDLADRGIGALAAAKRGVQRHLGDRGFPSMLRVTAHFGEVAIGPFGEGRSRQLDVIGDTVNIAASLGRGEHRGRLIISPQVFRKLSPPPLVYVAEE